MNDKSTIVVAAENLQAAADEKIEGAQLATEAALEFAADRVAAAEETAQQLADAALQTELGRQVVTLREEFSSWRTQSDQKISALETELQAVKTAPPVILAADLSSSTLPASEAPAEEPAQEPGPTFLPTASASAGAPEVAARGSESERRRRRLL